MVILRDVITDKLLCFQKYGLDKLLASHGHFNLLAPVNAALNQIQSGSRKVGNTITARVQFRYYLRSSVALLLVPPISSYLSTLGDSAFQSAAPMEWNKLPAVIRNIKNLEVLKLPFKLIFLIAFK